MPLTVRQFDLGIDHEIDKWMSQIYGFLAAKRDLAFSSEELLQAVLGDSPETTRREKFGRVMNVLAEIRAVGKRWVGNSDYYIFLQEFDTNTWERDPDSFNF